MAGKSKAPSHSRENRFAVKRGALPPSAQVQHFNEDEWEDFIDEACRYKPHSDGDQYVYIKRLGGAGDGGRDIEARFVETHEEGRWDLYQAKHYAAGITPSVFFPELAKFFRNLEAGVYTRPRRYFLCAPKNAGNDLHNLFADPIKFRNVFLNAWKTENTGLKEKKFQLTAEIEKLVQTFDFSIIRECLLRDLLDWHSANKKLHHELFGIESERGNDPLAPSTPSDGEQAYINELLHVYTENWGSTVSLADVVASESFGEHFQDQRSYFYCAEGLKQFSRDLYGDEEFSRLLSMVHIGIKPWLNSLKNKSGLDRLEASIGNVNTLKVDDSILAKRLRPGDLPGSCHHLANEKKVKWVK